MKKNEIAKVPIPTLGELIQESEENVKQNNLMVLLNQNPPKEWIKTHPMSKGEYLPIERVEYLLSRIFTKWWVEVRNTQVIANSVVVTVRLYVINPLTGQEQWNDGIGASPIQTDKDKGAMDWNYAKSDGVMKAAPSAESYAIKDACEKFGKIFGKDLNRKELISYDTLLKTNGKVDYEDLKELFELKRERLAGEDEINAERIIKNKEQNSYYKLFTVLKTL